MFSVPRTRLPRAALAVGLIALPFGAAFAQQQGGSDIKFTDTRLKNGLRIIVAEDNVAPVFSIAVSYNAGSRDERKGRTGFAHLFEHMMFKGSENVGPGEHFTLIFNNGGNMNGTTNKDRTLYYETLPTNQLDLGLYLEADRMRSLAITKDNLANQINAVQEERRLGVDNQPYGKTFEAVDSLAYSNFAYQHSVIGSMADLSAASVDDVAAFFKTYYAPNNAVIAIVGDVKTSEVLAKARKYFESIPSQPAPPAVDMSEPMQTAEKRMEMESQLARLTRIDIMYLTPPSDSDDESALTVLATVLGGGRSGRFYEQVVRQQELATSATASKGESRGPGLFRLGITVAPGKSAADVEQAVYLEIEKVKQSGVADWEVEKARSNARRGIVASLQNSLQRAVLLSEYALFYNEPGRINQRAQRINAVTAADVQRVANKYLTTTNRSVIVTTPKPAAGRGGE
ncbi:MAG: pitrilysin family protein [Gemmatimonadetes bacterium]|nr:pitrilysin family protein [Gemmatimonadota bacterium]